MRGAAFLPGVRADFDQAFDWYASRSERAALRFTEAIGETLDRISTAPESYAQIDAIHRQARVKRFPYRVVFRIIDTSVVIVALAHHSRLPDFWKPRGEESP